MKHLYSFSALLAAFLLLVSCAKEDPEVTLDPTSLQMLAAGGSQTVSLTTNYSWTATASDPWIQVSPASGDKGTNRLTIRVEASDRSTSRKGTVTIVCRDLSRGVTVSQMPQLSQSLIIKHTNSSFTVPVFSGSSMTGLVKWGDGSEEIFSNALQHTYTTAGSHTIEIQASGSYYFKIASVAGITEIDFEKF